MGTPRRTWRSWGFALPAPSYALDRGGKPPHGTRPAQVGGGQQIHSRSHRLLKRERGQEIRYQNPRGSDQAAASQVGETETEHKNFNKNDAALDSKASAVIKAPLSTPAALFFCLCEHVLSVDYTQLPRQIIPKLYLRGRYFCDPHLTDEEVGAHLPEVTELVSSSGSRWNPGLHPKPMFRGSLTLVQV